MLNLHKTKDKQEILRDTRAGVGGWGGGVVGGGEWGWGCVEQK